MTPEHYKNCDKKLHFLSENVKWGTMNVFRGMTLRWGQAWFKKIWSSDAGRDYIILSLQPKQNWKLRRSNQFTMMTHLSWSSLSLLSHFSSCSSISAHSSNVRSQWFKIIKSFIDGDRNAATVFLKYRPLNTNENLCCEPSLLEHNPAFLTVDSWLCSGKFQWFSFYRFSEPIL